MGIIERPLRVSSARWFIVSEVGHTIDETSNTRRCPDERVHVELIGHVVHVDLTSDLRANHVIVRLTVDGRVNDIQVIADMLHYINLTIVGPIEWSNGRE